MVETETCNNGFKTTKCACETQLSVVYDAMRVGCLLDTPLVYDYFDISA